MYGTLFLLLLVLRLSLYFINKNNNQKKIPAYLHRTFINRGNKLVAHIHCLFVIFLRFIITKICEKNFHCTFYDYSYNHTCNSYLHMQILLGKLNLEMINIIFVEQWSSKCVINIPFGIGRPYCRNLIRFFNNISIKKEIRTGYLNIFVRWIFIGDTSQFWFVLKSIVFTDFNGLIPVIIGNLFKLLFSHAFILSSNLIF